MSEKKRYRILIDSSTNTKAIRDRCSGFMNHIMERKLPWDIQFIYYKELQNRQILNRLIRKWETDGIYLNSPLGKASINVREIPNIVAFGNFDDGLPSRAVYVNIDNGQIAAEAFNLMLRRGLANFAYIHYPGPEADGDAIHSQMRGDAFMKIAKDSGFSCVEHQGNNSTPTDWTKSMVALAEELKRLPQPCGIMAYNDRCAREVIDACNYAKLRIPEQIQIVGVDNEVDVCENILPQLTSIEPDFVNAGRIAAQKMEDLLTSGSTQNRICAPCGVRHVIERDTTRDLSNSARLATAAEKLIRLHACRGLPPSPKGLTLKDLAAALNVSRSLLELRFSTVRGEGVATAIRREKLKEVCRLLKETDLSIGEIACRCGFPTQTHLNALFRSTFGSTLRDYRSLHRKSAY